VASRLPEDSGKERRRLAQKKAKKKGYPPSTAQLALFAWTLFLTTVPPTIGQTPTIRTVYPIRWHGELIFTSWKSSRHVASSKTKKVNATVCDLSGRMRLIGLT